jgi:hypothetical protein
MNGVEINYWAVVLAMVASMVVGMIWYAKPVFGAKWMKLVGLNDEKAKKGSGRAIAMTIVVSLLTAYVLAHVTYLSHAFYTSNSWMSSALLTAFWVWLGFVFTRIVTHDAFEQRPMSLTAMNIFHELVTFMAMGLVIGLMQP